MFICFGVSALFALAAYDVRVEPVSGVSDDLIARPIMRTDAWLNLFTSLVGRVSNYRCHLLSYLHSLLTIGKHSFKAST